jgi:hypothetical protein
MRPYLKNKAKKKKKKAGGVAQVVEHLPSKCKTLSSKPSIRGENSKKKKKIKN